MASLLIKKDFNVLITRLTDDFITLDDRTEFANLCKSCQVFVSIHSNHSPNVNASGIETFCVDDSFIFSQFSHKNQDNILSFKCKKCRLLASILHENILKSASTKQRNIIDRKVKNARFKVLTATDMPAVLVEVGFLSNKKEALLLRAEYYQRILAKGICNGIVSYFNTLDALKM